MTKFLPDNAVEKFVSELPLAVQAQLKRMVPLSRYCTYRVGGPAQLWLEPARDEDLLLVLRQAQKAGLPFFILGNGSNVIPPDQGVAGLVLHFSKRYSGIKNVGDDLVEVQAGAMLAQIARYAYQLQRRDFEWMVDIPASLGGALLMNAGNNQGTMSELVDCVRFIDADLQIKTLPVDELEYGYRHSRFKDKGEIILSAQLKLGPADQPENIKRRMREQREQRRSKFPMQFANAGSVFKRPPGDYAGRLIEASGLKGLRVGDAQVSEKHAGFIVNLGQAKAAHIAQLIKKVQQRVLADSGILLEPEQIFFAQ